MTSAIHKDITHTNASNQNKEFVTVEELLSIGMPKAVFWNNNPHKKVPTDIFIISTLQRAYNDFVVEKLVEFFGTQQISSALLKYKDRVSDTLIQQVTTYLHKFEIKK